MDSVSRLTKLFAPTHYTLSMSLQRAERTFSGTVTINGELSTGAEAIGLHAKDLTIHRVTLDGKKAVFQSRPNDELHITHTRLAPGKHVVVVEYSGTITDDMNGIYPSLFEVDGVKQELLATQFESHYARQAFPCVDEPEAKATFDVTLQTEPNITVLGNMPIKQQYLENDLLVTQFETTPRMSSYLVAWVAGALHKKTAHTKSGVEVSVWATPAQTPESLDFALDIATRTIDFFEDYFGVPYPLPKSDHVALPDFSAGAMENWGLITYREIALLVDPKITSISTKQYAALVVAHELSHQWFGNLVTMEWWNDLWLNESFANLMEYIAIDSLEPGWNIWLDYATSSVMSALRRDSLDGVQSVQVDVHHPDEISAIFDPSIVYAKGSRLLRMLESYIGTEALRTGLGEYFKKHAYQNTVADDLWEALSTASGKDVSSLMNSWIAQPGYPIIKAVRSDDATITLTQKQFFVGPHTDAGRLWPVPLHGSGVEVPELLENETVSFTYSNSSADPFRLNVSTTAHFITQYDAFLLKALTAHIHELSAVDRLAFIQEQLLIAQAGEQSYAALIPILQQFTQEPNEAVWTSISIALGELKRFVETDTQAETKLRNLAQDISAYHYERLGWDMAANETENDTKLRPTIISLALYGENPQALQEASRRYTKQPPEKLDELDPELRVAIMAHAVRTNLTSTVVDDLLAAHHKTANSEFRDDITAALTATKSPEVIERLIPLLQDSTVVRLQDFVHWYVWLLRNRFGRERMWQWTLATWPWIETTFKGDSHYDMFPRYIAGSLVTAQHLAEYTDFFTAKRDQKSLTRTIDMGITELQGRVSLLERDTPVVCAALRAL